MESLYRSADVLRRRRIVRSALGAGAGERILDLGCGPGFLTAEIADGVGVDGSVTGVDPSDAMLAVAERRCVALPQVELLPGSADSIPLADSACDRLVCVQVLEYVSDLAGAIDEMHRVLRPGGRLVAWDIDWSTVSIHSQDPGRAEAVLNAWDGHLEHPSLPRFLAPMLRSSGFENVSLEGHAFTATSLGDETYIGGTLPLIENYVAGSDTAAAAHAAEWASEQRRLDASGEFFFACLQFCFTADRS